MSMRGLILILTCCGTDQKTFPFDEMVSGVASGNTAAKSKKSKDVDEQTKIPQTRGSPTFPFPFIGAYR
jgi:hypothetical protein